jgi:hypothetical protein
LLTFAFTFGNFKSLQQNFSLAWAGSKFGNFGLGDGKSWKNKYLRYLAAAATNIIKNKLDRLLLSGFMAQATGAGESDTTSQVS